jgi:hypothetical protein
MKHFLAALLCCCLAAPAFAQSASPPDTVDPDALLGKAVPPPDPVPDKSQYTVFDPVPDDQMRAFSTDRPGKTHSSTTVDAGHFQLESDFYNEVYDHNSSNNQSTRDYSVANPILKLGITENWDLETAYSLYNRGKVTDRQGGATAVGNGFGNFGLGSKINLFGNEGDRASLAILPFVFFPTAASNVGSSVTQYELNVPYTYQLDTLWSVTAEPAFGYLQNQNDTGRHGDYSFLVNFNRPIITQNLVVAVEFASEYADATYKPRYTFDPSLQYKIGSGLQLDFGAYIGLNREAPDYNPYVGISFRY